ncbi:MAG: hypothetical protein JXB18_07070 [Sedimentisphaerales bacterium]|nr:hypothetical protein [Sedimentisphaerales bacterium]
MRVAIPLTQGKLSLHFGQCDQIAILEVNHGQIISRTDEVPPAHEAGLLQRWLYGTGVNIIFAGGMEPGTRKLFSRNGIQVIAGGQEKTPDVLISEYLQNKLQAGANLSDH